MKKLKEILLVDDSEGTLILNKRLLVKMGIVEKISVALHGKHALDYLNTKDEEGVYPCPEIVFLDIHMPVMNGYEFLEEYEKLGHNKRAKKVVVMLTSSISEIDIQKSKQYSSVKGYYFKPLTEEHVLHVMEGI